MANEAHLAKLKEGVTTWNSWRRGQRDFKADLSSVQLWRADLAGANLRGANLIMAELNEVDLSDADISHANLNAAEVVRSNLSGTNLQSTELEGATFHGTNLRCANLKGAILYETNLTSANLTGADLTGAKLVVVNVENAYFGHTTLADVDLSVVRGLNTVRHGGPSTIDIDTLFRSKGKIPEAFLRGCGVPEAFIKGTPVLVDGMAPQQFHPVFIVCSPQDQLFSEQLRGDLQRKQFRCWIAEPDIKICGAFQGTNDIKNRLGNRLLLILSEHSVRSDWVVKEIETALHGEHRHQHMMLYPIYVDESSLKVEMGWTAGVRQTRHLKDFHNWKSPGDYQKALDELIGDLNADDRIQRYYQHGNH